MSRPSYPRRALALAVGAVLGATALVGCGGGLEPGEAEQKQQLMPADAGPTVTPPPPDFMAGGIAEYPPPPGPDAGL